VIGVVALHLGFRVCIDKSSSKYQIFLQGYKGQRQLFVCRNLTCSTESEVIITE